MPDAFIYNGSVFSRDEKIIGPTSRALRYGDGIFETMRMKQGTIPLADLHFDRLFRGLNTLQFNVPDEFNPWFLREQIDKCAAFNEVADSARIRINVFRSAGSLQSPTDTSPHFIVEATALDPAYAELNSEGWTIDIFPHARKSCDLFSGLKHNNFQPYLMAAMYANTHQLDDALVLNQYERIADSTVANVFVLIKDRLVTNLVDEGCVDGVMRRWLVGKLKESNIEVVRQPLHLQNLLEADELFLTNAVAQMRWVKQFRKKTYTNEFTRELFQRFLKS